MKDFVIQLPYLWLAVLSVTAVILTIYDKIAAKRLPGRRVPERILFLVAVLGGSVAMYATMQLIRHKTQHKRFMIGIPVIFVLQLAFVFALILLF